MDTEYGNVLSSDQFRSPFDEVVKELLETGHVFHSSLRDYTKPQWRNRALRILLIDNPTLNAIARDAGDRDEIYIFRGAIEQLYGTILGLMSVPTFLPDVGNVGIEIMPKLADCSFTPVPLLRDRESEHASLLFPNDQMRMNVATVLINLALEFLVYHELGHIFGGHLEIVRSDATPAVIQEFSYDLNQPTEAQLCRRILEADADAFACHTSSWLHFHETNELFQLLKPCKWSSQEFGMVTFLAATAALFRALYPTAPMKISEYPSCYPHPAVRGCMVSSITMARETSNGMFDPAALEKLVAASVGNLERVWADLCLPGGSDEPQIDWSSSVGKASMDLLESFRDHKPILDQYARLSRNWYDWE